VGYKLEVKIKVTLFRNSITSYNQFCPIYFRSPRLLSSRESGRKKGAKEVKFRMEQGVMEEKKR
jgi:hypothetical protein